MTLEQLGLINQGLTNSQPLIYNPSYQQLFDAELSDDLPDNERGCLTTSGAVAINTGEFTGRSPKDKYIVVDDNSRDTVWWSDQGSDNQSMNAATWQHLKEISLKRLNGRNLYVIDGFCGANANTRLSVRLVTEVAWMAHFFKNMFIRPSADELAEFKPDWTIFNACKTTCQDYQQWGLNSETYIAFNIKERMTLIGGTWYGGEIKKGIFSIMNYFLPLQGIGSFHCSANKGQDDDTALFFGLSGTGKTTLSTDPKRALIGDDEHGWDNEGVFNLEGGCYAKTIKLSAEAEPDIYAAIRRDALLENVMVDAAGKADFNDGSKTENTRVSYPIYHIDNIVKPISKGRHPDKVIFLTCDAYGVLPPVSILSIEQAMYHFLSGYTAKVAGTERGVKEPTACFSSCFGQPFMLLHPTQYAKILGEKIKQHQARAYLVNTGWTGGAYGEGKRISIKNTRAIIDTILDGSIEQAPTEILAPFNLSVPTALPEVDAKILKPQQTWNDQAAYQQNLDKLARKFVANFERFKGTELGVKLVEFGPKITRLFKDKSGGNSIEL